MAATLIDMKLPKKEKKGMYDSAAMISDEGDRYPYGLQISLNTEEVKKLGIEDLDVEDKVKVIGVGIVSSKEVNQRQNSEVSMSIRIQIQKANVVQIKSLENMNIAEFMKTRNKGR